MFGHGGIASSGRQRVSQVTRHSRFRFVSEVPATFMQALVVWIQGHVRSSFDYAVGHRQVACNPAGYASRRGVSDNGNFDPTSVSEA